MRLDHFGGFNGGGQFWRPEIANPIIKKIANNAKTVRDREKVTIDHLYETENGLSEFAVFLIAMAMGMGETLQR